MKITIHAGYAQPGWPQRYVRWTGELNWPNVCKGMYWRHCSGWSAETIYDVFLCGPDTDQQRPDYKTGCDVQVEVKCSDEVLNHLVQAHGFTDVRW